MSHSVYKGPIELDRPLFVEGAAGEAIKPGNIVAPDFTLGDAATTGLLLILAEGGPGKGERIEDEYAIGAAVKAYNAKTGQRFVVRVGTGITLVDKVTLLERAADGQLAVLSAGEAVAVARESVTTSVDDQLVEVEVL